MSAAIWAPIFVVAEAHIGWRDTMLGFAALQFALVAPAAALTFARAPEIAQPTGHHDDSKPEAQVLGLNLAAVEPGMKAVRAVGVVTTIAYLITNGWFSETVDCLVEIKGGTNTLTRRGRDRLRNSIITLKSHAICGFNKDFVWPI